MLETRQPDLCSRHRRGALRGEKSVSAMKVVGSSARSLGFGDTDPILFGRQP
jgi:hypothetical protein